jgi:O-antigen/teichoic acid export membrane protein
MATTRDSQAQIKATTYPSISLESSEAKDLIRRAPMGYVWNQLGSLWLFGSSFLFTIVLTRGYAQENYGKLAVALTIYNTAIYIAAFGLEDASTVFVPRTLAEQGRDATAVLIRRTLLARLIGVGIIGLGLIWGLPLLADLLIALHLPIGRGLHNALEGTPGLDALRWPVAVYVIGTGLFNQLGAIFTALLRTRTTFVIGSLSQLANVIGAYIAIRAGASISIVLWVIAGISLMAALTYFVALAPFWAHASNTQSINSFWPVLRMGGTAWITNLISSALLKQVAVSLLQAFAISYAVVGYFNLAFQLTHAAAYLLIAGLGGVGLAAMSAAYAGQNHDSLSFAWQAISKVQILLAVPLLTFCFVYAPQLATALYGSGYERVGSLMQIFLVFNIIQRLCGGGVHQAALYVLNRQQLALLTQWIGLIITIVISCILIPTKGSFGGAAGALIGVGTGQVFVEISQLIMAWKFLKNWYPVRFGVRVLLALVPPTAVIWIWKPSSVIRLPHYLGPITIPISLSEVTVAITIFIIVLVGALAFSKPVERKDLTLLAGLNPRLGPILAPFTSGDEPSHL